MVKYFPILIKDASKKIRRQEDGRNHPQPIRIEDQQTATAMSQVSKLAINSTTYGGGENPAYRR
ncbi:hypothetical protein QC764_0018690 [Podospora pseudoanserina]|uniref:Uncharacterized protein n=1 Tax=Podospora pseudoanserina TaxID=2609844 RepID=A0ABR0IQM5_9PEZI|nr:hypothetical protein QC764_0018690 [Podospora pseudoanserina]